jgi:hypothetical protein
METSDRLQRRIRQFAEQLREEFGPLAVGEQSCLLEAAEEWGIRVGDELARAATQQELPAATAEPDEACCPKCQQLARWKGTRKRRVETRRGPIHVSEPEYYCPRCRRSFFPADPGVGDGA